MKTFDEDYKAMDLPALEKAKTMHKYGEIALIVIFIALLIWTAISLPEGAKWDDSNYFFVMLLLFIGFERRYTLSMIIALKKQLNDVKEELNR